MRPKLDSIDKKILTVLQRDAAKSTSEIAAEVGLSQAPCWRRIRRMEIEGIITDRITRLNRALLGLDVMVFARIKLQAHGKNTLPDFEAAIRRLPQIVECHTLMGDTDYLLKIIVPSVAAYERLFREHLSQLPAVRETISEIALTEIKSMTVLPIETLGDE